MKLIVLAFNLLYILVPAIVIVTVLAGFLNKNKKAKRRRIMLDQFRSASFRSENELAWYIAHDVMGKAGFPDCVVYKVDLEEKVCRQVAAFGPKNPDKMSILNPINIPFGRGIVGHVATSGQTEKIDDTSRNSRYVPDDDVRYSELTVPVLLNGRVVMVIDSEHKNRAWFKDSDVEFVQRLANITEEKLGRILN